MLSVSMIGICQIILDLASEISAISQIILGFAGGGLSFQEREVNSAPAALALAGMGIIAAVIYAIEGDRALIVVSAVMFTAAAWQIRLSRK
ncbi:hypothetical protein [Shinella granuli]|uniref:hypothetical protein n=1 Tax=Shinella granuli TaxID=323621 RepID=UPI00105482EE|nr:hypothetical protein [Shinella granuli]